MYVRLNMRLFGKNTNFFSRCKNDKRNVINRKVAYLCKPILRTK